MFLSRSLSAPRRRLYGLGAALVVGLLVLGGRSFIQANRATQLRESYLDDLLRETPKNSRDGAAQALLGGRLAQVDRFDEAAERLAQAVESGERAMLWCGVPGQPAWSQRSDETKRWPCWSRRAKAAHATPSRSRVR